MVDHAKLPPLPSIRAFEAAARLESFAKAAQELGTTAASVSYHIRQLERQTGLHLFIRHPHKVALTAAGAAIAREASAAFAARSEERRVGNECGRTCITRGVPYH